MKGCLSSVELFVYCYGSSNNGICTVTYESQGNARPAMCIDCQGDEECIRGDENNLPTTTYFHGSCVSFLDANGMVVRGNVVDYPEYQGSSQYAECFSDVCNGGLFPDDRLLCYQCSGEQCARLPLEPAIKPEPCLRYDKANAKCYTWYDSLSNAQRGCVLDDSVCETDGVLCQDCADSGCNVLGYDDFDDTRVCVQCSSNRACDENPAEEICTGDGGCYKFFLSELLVTAKGCVSELKESMVWYDECASSDSDRCERCYGDYCNRNRCYVCNSLMGVGGSCIEPSVGSTESSTCTESDECVAFIDDDGHTVRGCRDSFEPEQLLDCSETSQTCVRCTGEYCNGGPLPRDRIKCYQCARTPDCLNPPKSSELYCDIYREGEDSCYTLFQDETTVERGCTLQRSEPCEQPCQQCNTTGCNNQPAFVQNSLSCAQCSDDDCPPINEPADPALVKPCPDEILFGRIDQCYSYFYPNGTIVKGCFGELAKSDVDLASQCSDPSDVTCKLCTGDGCNARSVTCFVCDTDTFPGCADNLSESGHSLYVEACGTGQCVSVLQGTVTRKGCSEDYKVLCESDGSDVTCETFDGSISNRAVYPADRLQCFQCQGSSCDVIESTTRSASACQQYNPTDECYTYVSDSGETFRGCVSDLQASNPCIEQSDLCVRCNSELACNNQPAIRSNELICAQCTRAVECEAMEQRFEKCTQPVLLGRPDSCYVQAFAGEILARGCLSDAPLSLRDKCAENGAPNSECSLCLCDRCNGPSVQCVSCEDETGCGGILGAEAKLAACETSSCVSFVKHLTNGSLLIVKGCSELYERETCGKGQPGEESYQLCHSPGCNDVLFPVDRLKCYQCEDAACSDPCLEPTICEPYSEGDKCYSFLDRQQKGCLGQLENATEECTEGRCSVCDVSDGCNEEPRALECFVCSSKNDPSCVDPTATVMSKKMCLVGGCITLIDDDGYTVRGCANEYDASPESCTGMDAATTTCNVCTEGDACNGALFPANRLRCYQCSGASCLDVSLQQVAVCQRYNANDACYMYATSPTDIRRGCLSDTTFQCSEECVTCTSANGCNDDPPIVPNALTCHHCDGADCAMQQTGKGSACPNVLLGRTDACYTFAEKYTVRRGCLSEQTACNPTNENCHICT
uniref:DUF753 domain-containing protein n=1 Tax=Anopheles maculatus TaxID=74869 RepID=A0A182TAL1_9DIPT